jgi:7-carboxy-7-deazaguanine synthase
MRDMSTTLQVSEIFKSIQGESTAAGWPCVLVRLAGCNLNCNWCDTRYARSSDAGEAMSIEQILRHVADLDCPRVELTGGEPLQQAAAGELLAALCDAGYETLLETNGSSRLADVDPRVRKIVDVKCPASGEQASTRWENLAALDERDELKFVIADRGDYDYATAVLCGDVPSPAEPLGDTAGISSRVAVTFSPVAGQLDPAELAGWILADGLDVRLGLQLHKIIWPEKDRGV